MKKITSKQISDELNVSLKPTFYTNTPVPLNALSDRCFEILLYHIYKELVKVKDQKVYDIADTIQLMPGVAEQGRDILLSKRGKNTGLIQCKKYKSNLTYPELCKEVLKFILYYLHDNELIGSETNFHYIIAVSTGLAGTAIGAFNNLNNKLIEEPKLQEWVEAIFKDYPKKFTDWTFLESKVRIVEAINKIKFDRIIPQDIEYYLSEFEPLNKLFFKVLTVTDNTLLEKIIDIYLKPILYKIELHEIDRPDFTFRFKEYLRRGYETYSSAKTLVFGNQQKKLEDIYYPLTVLKVQKYTQSVKSIEFKIDNFSDSFIPQFKKVLIVDDGGMGKSTLMKWLFLSAIKQNKGIPIFIELRKINRENDILSEIVSCISSPTNKIERDACSKILTNKGFIFLFDGYDEVNFQNREFVTIELQNFINVRTESEFVITSRPEGALNTFSNFQEFRIKKLVREEAFELIKKIDNYQDRSVRLIEAITSEKFKGINEFLSNPLLVSLLYKKFEHRESISLSKNEFFYEVFEALFKAHDLSKGESFIRKKESQLEQTQFFQILRGVGYHSIIEGVSFTEAQLVRLIDKVMCEFSIIVDPLLFISDITKAVPLFQRDGQTIKWAHKSLQQYFAAEYICRDTKEKQGDILRKLYKSKNLNSYLNILELCGELDPKVFKIAVLKIFCNEMIELRETMFTTLKKSNRLSPDEIEERISLIGDSKFVLSKGDNKHPFGSILTSNEMKESDFLLFAMRTKDEVAVLISNQSLSSFTFRSFLNKINSNLIQKPFNSNDLNLIDSNLPLQPNEVFYCDNDDLLNPLNSSLLFKQVNNLLSHYTSKVDYNSVKKLLVEIEKLELTAKEIQIPEF